MTCSGGGTLPRGATRILLRPRCGPNRLFGDRWAPGVGVLAQVRRHFCWVGPVGIEPTTFGLKALQDDSDDQHGDPENGS